jgi:hypothetical protein
MLIFVLSAICIQFYLCYVLFMLNLVLSVTYLCVSSAAVTATRPLLRKRR